MLASNPLQAELKAFESLIEFINNSEWANTSLMIYTDSSILLDHLLKHFNSLMALQEKPTSFHNKSIKHIGRNFNQEQTHWKNMNLDFHKFFFLGPTQYQ